MTRVEKVEHLLKIKQMVFSLHMTIDAANEELQKMCDHKDGKGKSAVKDGICDICDKGFLE